MFQFNYNRAESVEDVCEKLWKYKEEIRIIAGGTDLMVQLREKDEKWKDIKQLLDITFLESELRYVREGKDAIHIGTLCTHTDLENSSIIQKYIPFLGKACGTVGSPQIRNLGTIGGSICNGSPAADPLTPLVASDATVVIRGRDGWQELNLEDLYQERGKKALREGGFVTEFLIKKQHPDRQTSFIKLGRRKALAISRLNVAAAMVIDEFGIIQEAAISPGCIFTKPDRVKDAESILIGQKPSRELFEQSGLAVSAEMIIRTGVRWSTEYKQPAIEGMVSEALLMAARGEV